MIPRPAHRWIASLMVLAIGCVADEGGGSKAGWSMDPGAAQADTAGPTADPTDDPPDTGVAYGGGDTGAGGADAGAADGDDAPAAEPDRGAPCAALRLSDLSAADDDGDGAWRAGEVLWVQATIENTGDDAFFDYPGATVHVETTGVLAPEATAWVYSLEAGERALLEWWVIGAPTDAAAAEVLLQLEVVTGACGRAPVACPEAEPARLRVPLSDD